MENIAIIGFSGTGKSQAARAVADILGALLEELHK